MALIKVNKTSRVFEVSFNYNEKLIQEIRKIQGRKYDKINRRWEIPLRMEQELKEFLDKYNLPGESKSFLQFCYLSTYKGSPSETPVLPSSWNRLKKEYAALLSFKDGKIKRDFLGDRTDFSSSRKNANIEYSDSEKNKIEEVGSILEVKDGSYKNITREYYRKDVDGWKYIGKLSDLDDIETLRDYVHCEEEDFDTIPKGPKTENTETIFNGQYFKNNPSKVLGEIRTHNPNTGKLLTDAFGKPRPEVRGTIEDVIKGIDVPKVQRFEHFVPMQVQAISPKKDANEKGLTKEKINKAIAKTKVEKEDKQSRNKECSDELQCLSDTIVKYNSNVEYKDENGNIKYYSISEEEIKVWVTYQTNRGLFNLDVIKDNDWGAYYVATPDWMDWWQKGLVGFDGYTFEPTPVFYSGNIYEKLNLLKAKKQIIIEKGGEALYEEQLSKMEASKPKQLLITDDESRKLYLSPFANIWSKIKIEELADGTTLEDDYSIGSIFYTNYLEDLSAQELTIDNKTTTASDIYKYWILKERFPNNTSPIRKAAIRRNTALIGTYHFDRFLMTMLTERDKAIIVHIWNSETNNYKPIDYHKVPVGFTIGKKFKGGNLSIRPAQREGVAFMNHRGTGIVAYDVGVGKTMTAILGIADGFAKGLFKRVLVVVPQKVIKKWIGEIVGVKNKEGKVISEGILPNITINNYDNLGVDFIDKAMDKNGIAYTVAEYSITMVTYEGLAKIGFNASSEKDLISDLKLMLSQGESGRDNAIKIEKKAEDWVDSALNGTELDIEEMGIDAIVVDETHNFRNLFMGVRGDVDKNGDREKKNFFAGTNGKPRQRALKLFMLNTYIHQKHNNRNTYGLTATPFTNRAMEIYSMMAHYDYQGLKDYGVYNIAQFCEQFIDETYEEAWTAEGGFAVKAVIRGYNNLDVLQSMVFRSINYKTGEEANIKRPTKVILPLLNDEKGIPLSLEHQIETKLKPTKKQEYWFREIVKFANKDIEVRRNSRINDYYSEYQKGNTLIALNAMSMVTFSPYVLRLADESIYDVSKITSKEFVDGSPKIKYTIECIKTIKEYHEANNTPVSGQIIYSTKGTDWFNHIREYLVSEVGYKSTEVVTFHGKTTKINREKIKEGFLAGTIKVIIGSSTLLEGVYLQTYNTVIYDLFLDWNPTDIHQLMGRGWRFGNIFGYIRFVVPLMENSSDIFTWQKLSEKMSRLNSIWTRSDKTKMFEESELNAEELKRGLINNPRELVRFDIEEEVGNVKSELAIVEGDLEELQQVGNIKDSYNKLTALLRKWAEEAISKPITKWSVKQESKDKLRALQITDIKSVYRIVSRYAQLQDYYYSVEKKQTLDQHKKYTKRLKKLEDTILKKNKLKLSDDMSLLIIDYQKRVEVLTEELTRLNSQEHFDKKLLKVTAQKEAEQKSQKTLAERVNEFARLNYLLDCKFGVHVCDIYGRVQEIKKDKLIATKEQSKKVLKVEEKPIVKSLKKISEKELPKKKILEIKLKGYTTALRLAKNEDQKSKFRKLIKGYKTALRLVA